MLPVALDSGEDLQGIFVLWTCGSLCTGWEQRSLWPRARAPHTQRLVWQQCCKQGDSDLALQSNRAAPTLSFPGDARADPLAGHANRENGVDQHGQNPAQDAGGAHAPRGIPLQLRALGGPRADGWWPGKHSGGRCFQWTQPWPHYDHHRKEVYFQRLWGNVLTQKLPLSGVLRFRQWPRSWLQPGARESNLCTLPCPTNRAEEILVKRDIPHDSKESLGQEDHS